MNTYDPDHKVPAILGVTVDDLISAYSGKLGCACGCRGTHSYMDAAEGTRSRGYTVDPGEVSRTRVQNVLTFLKKHASEVQRQDGIGSGWIYWLETPTRLYMVYTRSGRRGF